MPSSPLPLPELAPLALPAHWQAVEFLSDVHLQPKHPRTAEALFAHLNATDADAVFLLGDLFEVWIGDDALQDPHGPEAGWCRQLAEAATRRPLYLLHGNRDFLWGEAASRASGVTWLPDPAVLHWSDAPDAPRLLVTHGDALCLDDTAYQQFRAVARTPAWQQQFLALPLPQRRQAARALRDESREHQQQAPVYAEVDGDAALQWLRAAQAPLMIHGHTHRPGAHVLAADATRWVLSDWELDGPTPRADVLRWERAQPHTLQRLAPRA